MYLGVDCGTQGTKALLMDESGCAREGAVEPTKDEADPEDLSI